MSTYQTKNTYRYCRRLFSVREVDHFRELIGSNQHYNRAQLSRIVCENLHWLRPDGRLKDMSCRIAMQQKQNDDLIRLPSPKRINGNGRIKPQLTPASECKNSIEPPYISSDKLSCIQSIPLTYVKHFEG